MVKEYIVETAKYQSACLMARRAGLSFDEAKDEHYHPAKHTAFCSSLRSLKLTILLTARRVMVGLTLSQA